MLGLINQWGSVKEMYRKSSYVEEEMNSLTATNEVAVLNPGNLLRKAAPVCALLVLVADQISKLWVREGLLLGESIPQGGVLRITHMANPGIIFGFPAPSAVSVLLSVAAIVVFIFMYRAYVSSDSRLLNVGVGLFIGGSLGNLVDRIAFGSVTDFIDVGVRDGLVRTTFNLADVCIIAGIILFGIFFVRYRLREMTKST